MLLNVPQLQAVTILRKLRDDRPGQYYDQEPTADGHCD